MLRAAPLAHSTRRSASLISSAERWRLESAPSDVSFIGRNGNSFSAEFVTRFSFCARASRYTLSSLLDNALSISSENVWGVA